VPTAETTEGHGVVAVALVVLCRVAGRCAVRQWSAGRTWYSKSSPPTQISRMIAEIVIAQA
jgi:hypothetical protein